jgi:hypothetical protein
VIDHAGWPAAAIAVTFARGSREPSSWGALADETRGHAHELSRRIGGIVAAS